MLARVRRRRKPCPVRKHQRLTAAPSHAPCCGERDTGGGHSLQRTRLHRISLINRDLQGFTGKFSGFGQNSGNSPQIKPQNQCVALVFPENGNSEFLRRNRECDLRIREHIISRENRRRTDPIADHPIYKINELLPQTLKAD